MAIHSSILAYICTTYLQFHVFLLLRLLRYNFIQRCPKGTNPYVETVFSFSYNVQSVESSCCFSPNDSKIFHTILYTDITFV